MTAGQKSKLAQGLVFGLLFLYLGYFIKGCAGSEDSIKITGKFVMVMGGLIVIWGAWQGFGKRQ